MSQSGALSLDLSPFLFPSLVAHVLALFFALPLSPFRVLFPYPYRLPNLNTD